MRRRRTRLFNLSFLMLVLSGCVIGIITFFFAEPDCTAVWMSAECTWLCHVLSEDLFLRNGIYHAGTGNEPFVLTQGYSFLSMCFVLMGTVLNIVLDPLFIFTFGMGVQGSALATVLAQFLSAVCTVGFFFSRKSLFHFRRKEMHFSAERICQHCITRNYAICHDDYRVCDTDCV